MSVDKGIAPVLPMPIKAAPYKHQIEAFNFVCEMFGLMPEGGAGEFPVRSAGCALLMGEGGCGDGL